MLFFLRVHLSVIVVKPASSAVLYYCQTSLGDQLCITIVNFPYFRVHMSVIIAKPALETTCFILLSNLPYSPSVYNYCETFLGDLPIATINPLLENQVE